MFSMAKFLNAHAHPADIQAQRDADNELQQVTRGKNGGYVIPPQSVRDISTASGSGDGVVQEDHFADYFVESLIAENYALEQATVYSGLKDKTVLPAEDTISTVEWVAENAAPTESDPVTRAITLTPKRLTTFVDMSRRLLVMGQPDVEDLIWSLMTRRVARAIDHAIMFGSGVSNQPTGMASLTGKNANINLTVANSKKGTNIWAALGSAEQALAEANIEEGSIMALLSPAFYRNCRWQAYDGSGTRTTADSKMAILPEMDSMLLEQYPQKKTGAITTAQGMFLADWSEVVVGQFTEGFEVVVNPYILDKEGLVRITITSLCDIQFKHAKSFQQITVS